MPIIGASALLEGAATGITCSAVVDVVVGNAGCRAIVKNVGDAGGTTADKARIGGGPAKGAPEASRAALAAGVGADVRVGATGLVSPGNICGRLGGRTASGKREPRAAGFVGHAKPAAR